MCLKQVVTTQQAGDEPGDEHDETCSDYLRIRLLNNIPVKPSATSTSESGEGMLAHLKLVNAKEGLPSPANSEGVYCSRVHSTRGKEIEVATKRRARCAGKRPTAGSLPNQLN